jgi:hypothetical protein
MIAIFVPKNEDELKKYRKAIDFEKRFVKGSLKSLSDYFNTKNVSNKPKNRKERLEKSNQQEPLNIIYNFFKNKEDDVFVIIVENMPDKEEMVDAFNDEFPRVNARKYLNIFRSLADEITGKKTDVSEIVVFIHWGGGNPIKMENGFRKNCNDLEHAALRLFSISSRRSDKFNVNGSIIEVPKTLKEISALINRFSFDKVKTLLTDYVVKIDRIEDMDIQDGDIEEVFEYLTWIDERYRDSIVFDKNEKMIWREVMDKVKIKNNPFLTYDAINADYSIKNKQDFINKIIHVYSRIIEEGMGNE